jgi:ABC-2 type transport system permease protein
MVGVAVFLVGLKPKLTGIVWVYFGYTFFFLFFGQLVEVFPEWLTYLTPYAFVTRLPLAPGETINFIALGAKAVIAAVLTAAGFYFYNKRDINAITH